MIKWINERSKSPNPGGKAIGILSYPLVIDGEITLEVTPRKMKTLRLSIRPDDGVIRLSVPLRASRKTILMFIEESIPWIKKQQERLRLLERPPKAVYTSGETHKLWGIPYRLQVIERTGRPKVTLLNDVIQLFIAPGSSFEQRERMMNNWYRKILRTRIPSLLTGWESIVGRKACEWAIKKMRTKWGTCNTTHKRIWFSLELAKKPLPFLEFIIVHELTHLHERNHNKRFYALMDKFMPDWREKSSTEYAENN